jgi:hypothetical protein
MKRLLLSSIGAAALLLSLAWAADAADPKKPPLPTFNDPAEAGPDFKVQGEYTADLEIDGQSMPVGVQVIAQGEGKFHVVAYFGGFPGAGYKFEKKVEADAETIDGIATIKKDELISKITDDKITVYGGGGGQVAQFTRVERTSPTLGAKPPEGAVVLFDGTTADNFINGRMTDDGLLMEGVTSKQLFNDFSLHLEFRLPFMPTARGQARSNSGCYLQGRYEVQILDSFGLEGKDNECGGIYKISAPKVNMCFPPLVWQTYDIDYTAARYDADAKKTANARVTVRHNGVVIQDDLEVPVGTNGGPLKEGPEPGPIFLQNHGNPVRFRNIWVVEKKA